MKKDGLVPHGNKIEWRLGDPDFCQFIAQTGTRLQTCHHVQVPSQPVVKKLYFEGSDFIWCSQGAFRFDFSDRESLEVRAGEFLITFPGRFVSITGLEAENQLHYGVLLGERHQELLLRLGFWDGFKTTAEYPQINFEQIEKLLERNRNLDDEGQLQALVMTSDLLRTVRFGCRIGDDAIFLDAVREINGSFLAGEGSVKSIYSKLRISPTRLNAIFSRHGLRGPGEYLRTLQVWWACHMLRHTRLTLEEVAQACAYSCNTSFTRALRTWLGVSPAQVRGGTAYKLPGAVQVQSGR